MTLYYSLVSRNPPLEARQGNIWLEPYIWERKSSSSLNEATTSRPQIIDLAFSCHRLQRFPMGNS